MKKFIFFLLGIALFFACTPSEKSASEKSERDDAKYLGTWKSNPVLDNGTYNYVKIELSGDDEFPYRLTPCQFSGSSKKHYEFKDKRYKIRDGRLVGETIEGGYEYYFQIKEKDNEFIYRGDNPTSGPLKNHTK